MPKTTRAYDHYAFSILECNTNYFTIFARVLTKLGTNLKLLNYPTMSLVFVIT